MHILHLAIQKKLPQLPFHRAKTHRVNLLLTANPAIIKHAAHMARANDLRVYQSAISNHKSRLGITAAEGRGLFQILRQRDVNAGNADGAV